MAWDSTRPVPWNRLIREWLIYAAIMTAVFLLFFRGDNVLGAIAGVLISGPLYLGFGAVMAKFGYQRTRLKDVRGAAKNAPESTTSASTPRRRFTTAEAGADQSYRWRRQPTEVLQSKAALMARPDDPRCVIAIDAGTTGVRSRAVFADGRPAVAAYREFAQHYPSPGWVEHDAV